MSLDSFNIIRPGQNLGTGDELANHYPEFTGEVEGTIERRAKIAQFVDIKPVQGTSTLSKDGIGESTLGVITPGETPDQTSDNQFNQNSLVVDTVVLARTTIPMLDVFQKRYDVRMEVAREHGKKLSKLFDTSFAIQAIKAARLATSKYALPGHAGGSQVNLGSAADARDPAALYSAIADLLATMEDKDVDPQADGVVLALRPAFFYALSDAEQIVNGEYTVANTGAVIQTKMLKAWGIPVISTNSVPNTAITNHPLSNTRNSNAYDGDFSKVVAVAFAPEAVMAGQTIPVSTKVWFDDLSKSHYVDAWLSWAATTDRAEYAGVIQLP